MVLGMPISQQLLPEFDEEMKKTRSMLERVPDGKFDFQPHPKSMNLARLATHVAELPGFGKAVLESEVMELAEGTQFPAAKSRAELLDKFDKCAAETRAMIEATPDDAWEKTWTFKYAGTTYISAPRKAVMRSDVMSHLVHHRAQLGVYLRLNGVPVPGMYGPSADEMPG